MTLYTVINIMQPNVKHNKTIKHFEYLVYTFHDNF